MCMDQNSALLITKLQSKRLHGVHGKRVCSHQEVVQEINASSSGTVNLGSYSTPFKLTLRYAPCNGTHMRRKSCHPMVSLTINYVYGSTQACARLLSSVVTPAEFCTLLWAPMAQLWLVQQPMKPWGFGKYFSQAPWTQELTSRNKQVGCYTVWIHATAAIWLKQLNSSRNRVCSGQAWVWDDLINNVL